MSCFEGILPNPEAGRIPGRMGTAPVGAHFSFFSGDGGRGGNSGFLTSGAACGGGVAFGLASGVAWVANGSETGMTGLDMSSSMGGGVSDTVAVSCALLGASSQMSLLGNRCFPVILGRTGMTGLSCWSDCGLRLFLNLFGTPNLSDSSSGSSPVRADS